MEICYLTNFHFIRLKYKSLRWRLPHWQYQDLFDLDQENKIVTELIVFGICDINWNATHLWRNQSQEIRKFSHSRRMVPIRNHYLISSSIFSGWINDFIFKPGFVLRTEAYFPTFGIFVSVSYFHTSYSRVWNRCSPLNKCSQLENLTKRINVAPYNVQTYVVKFKSLSP